jgi:hypothetical protein
VERYWIFEREALTVFANHDGRFVETQRIEAGHVAETVGPVTLSVDPGSYPTS